MKKKLVIVLAAILTVIACVTSCDKAKELVNTEEKTVETIEEYLNPTFDDVNVLLTYRDVLSKEHQMDSIFLSLPEPVLKNVTTVLLNKYGETNQEDVVNEYVKNKEIYDNLRTPPLPSTNETNDSTDKIINGLVRESGAQKTRAVMYEFKDSIINGKKVRIKITHEITEDGE